MNTLVWMNAAVASITMFRFLMYTFALEMNTRTKISPEKWVDEGVQELAYGWTRSLRMLFGLRLLVTLVICYGGDVYTNWLFLLATILYNFIFLLDLLGVTGGVGLNRGKVVQSEHIMLPKVITWVHFLLPLFFALYYYFFI